MFFPHVRNPRSLAKTFTFVACLAVTVGLPHAGFAQSAVQPAKTKTQDGNAYLESGRLEEGIRAATEQLKNRPDLDDKRFELGLLQTFQAIEHLSANMYRSGTRQEKSGLVAMLPIVRLPLPTNPNPEVMTYAQARKTLQQFVDDLAKADKTLALIKDPGVKFPLAIGLVKLDLNGDGDVSESERFWKIYATLNRNVGVDAASAAQFHIRLDYADVFWLRAYTHFLSGLCEFLLAHDGEDLFNHIAHLIFLNVRTPYAYVAEGENPENGFAAGEIADAVAMIHLIRLPVAEPARMKAALGHLESMVQLSQRCFEEIQKETDNDNEWIPNANQNTVIPNTRVSGEMITAWLDMLKEFKLILAGERLIPHWRSLGGRGINLNKVFLKPQTFDLVLWIQGSAAEPFLEKGVMTSPNIWNQVQRVFRGEFFGFAIWFN